MASGRRSTEVEGAGERAFASVPDVREPERPASRFAYLTYPLFMATFMGVSFGCMRAGVERSVWIPSVTVLNFLVLLALEQLFPRRPAMNTLRDRQSVNDAFHGLLTGLLRPLGSSFGLLLLAGLNEARLGSAAATLWPGSWPLVPQVVLAHLVVSFASYWVHRSQHEVDRLWWFHALHHDTEQLHVLKSGRFHFMDELYSAVLTPLPLLLFGASTDVVVLQGIWSVFNGSLSHANTQQRFPDWFHYVISTVDVHNLHHARERRFQDSNYTGMPVWDVLFGTFSHPSHCRAETFGLADQSMPRGVAAQLWFPFRAQIRAPLRTSDEPASVPVGPR